MMSIHFMATTLTVITSTTVNATPVVTPIYEIEKVTEEVAYEMIRCHHCERLFCVELAHKFGAWIPEWAHWTEQDFWCNECLDAAGYEVQR